jgi:hypothetical protein
MRPAIANTGDFAHSQNEHYGWVAIAARVPLVGVSYTDALIGRSRIPRVAGCSHRRIMVAVLAESMVGGTSSTAGDSA